MKKFLLIISCISFLLISCSTTAEIQDGEELVEYRKYNYKVLDKKFLTEKEIDEDLDWLKYFLYNTYAGIDEAIENGFDLDATILEIKEQTLAKKDLSSGLYPSTEFNNITRAVFSKNLTNTDLHINIYSRLHDPQMMFYSNIYFTKNGEKYIVTKSDVDAIKIGDIYTGPENNLYKYLTDDGEQYRFALSTKKRITSGIIQVNNTNVTIKVENEKVIPSKDAWTGFKTTEKTLYMSLGDCMMAYGNGKANENNSSVWDKFMDNISKNAQGKENIIFDLRSNGGGYREFPAEMLAAAYYNKHPYKKYRLNIMTKMINDVSENTTFLVSPITMMQMEGQYKDYAPNLYERLTTEQKIFFEDYWKNAKHRPIRKQVSLVQYETTFEKYPTPDFQGTIYVLLNRSAGSAAEFGTEMTYLLKNQGINVVLVGENSWGGVKYGGMYGYKLPNSGLGLSVGNYFGESPTLQSIPNWKGEGKGFYPDYWATNDTILNTLEDLIKDPQLKETLIGLDKGQL